MLEKGDVFGYEHCLFAVSLHLVMERGMAAVSFPAKNEAQLRQWMEAKPGRVNDKDVHGETPLSVAVCHLNNVPLTAWLLDEKGADLDTRRGS